VEVVGMFPDQDVETLFTIYNQVGKNKAHLIEILLQGGLSALREQENNNHRNQM
jgi:hypothetical protein